MNELGFMSIRSNMTLEQNKTFDEALRHLISVFERKGIYIRSMSTRTANIFMEAVHEVAKKVKSGEIRRGR